MALPGRMRIAAADRTAPGRPPRRMGRPEADNLREIICTADATARHAYSAGITNGAGDAAVVREDVDEASTMAHDAVADLGEPVGHLGPAVFPQGARV